MSKNTVSRTTDARATFTEICTNVSVTRVRGANLLADLGWMKDGQPTSKAIQEEMVVDYHPTLGNCTSHPFWAWDEKRTTDIFKDISMRKNSTFGFPPVRDFTGWSTGILVNTFTVGEYINIPVGSEYDESDIDRFWWESLDYPTGSYRSTQTPMNIEIVGTWGSPGEISAALSEHSKPVIVFMDEQDRERILVLTDRIYKENNIRCGKRRIAPAQW